MNGKILIIVLNHDGRDLYYKDVSLFKKQSAVDNVSYIHIFVIDYIVYEPQIVDDIAATLALNRSDLNVVG